MIKITWQDFHELSNKLGGILKTRAKKYDFIYGVPRGGIPLALTLSGMLGIPLLEGQGNPVGNVLVCDDIIDSGTTRMKFPECDFVALVHKHTYIPNQLSARIYRDGIFWKYGDMPKDIYGESSVTITAREVDAWTSFPWETEQDDNGEDIVRRMLQFIGEDPNRPGLKGDPEKGEKSTPQRVVEMWKEVFRGYHDSQIPNIMTVDNDNDGIKYHDMLIDSGYFFTFCEHHILPFWGDWYFGYIPRDKVLGLSKIGRLIDHFAARLQVGERLVGQVADYIMEQVEPEGLILVMQARHLCKEMRGLRKYDSPAEVIAVRGCFYKDKEKEEKFLLRIPKLK